jgi:predicted nucleic acid-binding protein
VIFVDSSIWIDYFNGTINAHTDYLHEALGSKNIVIGDVILMEVLQGFRLDKDFKKARELLLLFPVFELLGKDLAIQSAVNYRELRKKGVAVRKSLDVIIATFCISKGMQLLHNDKDFKPMEKYLKLKIVKV